MQNESYTTYLSQDQRLSQISESRPIEVLNGPNSSTFNVFTPTTTTNSLIDFNVSIPSQSLCVDRHVLISATVNLEIDISVTTAGDIPFLYGMSNGFAPYPLNNIFTNSSITVNNANINSSTQNIISPLLRLNESAELQRHNSMTPSMPDSSYLYYADGLQSNNNVLADYQNGSYNNNLNPRGSYAFDSLTVIQTYVNAAGDNCVATYLNTNNTVTTSLVVAGAAPVIPSTVPPLIAQADGATFKVLISSTFTEPLIGMGPLTFSSLTTDKAGIIGLNQLNLS